MVANFLVGDRVKETSTTTGTTSPMVLAGAETGFQSFAIVGDGNYTYYVMEDGTWWETGIGLYTASGTTLTRNVISSSGGGGSAVNTAVNWGAGSKNVFCSRPATEDLSSAVVKTADYTATVRDSIILCDTTSGTITITLPTIAAAFTGKRFMIKKISTDMNEVKIQDGGSSGFDVLADEYLYANGEFIEFMAVNSTGSTWAWLATAKHLIPNCAKMKQTGSQSITASSWVTMTFNTTVYELGCDADPGVSNAITIQRAGKYRVAGNATIDFSTDAHVYFAIAQVPSGGGTPVDTDFQVVNANYSMISGNNFYGTVETDLLCAAVDSIYLMIFHNESAFTPPGTMTGRDMRETQLSVSEIV